MKQRLRKILRPKLILCLGATALGMGWYLVDPEARPPQNPRVLVQVPAGARSDHLAAISLPSNETNLTR